MIVAIDVHYFQNKAVAAGVIFEDWSAKSASEIVKVEVANVAPSTVSFALDQVKKMVWVCIYIERWINLFQSSGSLKTLSRILPNRIKFIEAKVKSHFG